MFWKRRGRRFRSASRRSARRFATKSRRAISPSARANSSRWNWNFSSGPIKRSRRFAAAWRGPPAPVIPNPDGGIQSSGPVPRSTRRATSSCARTCWEAARARPVPRRWRRTAGRTAPGSQPSPSATRSCSKPHSLTGSASNAGTPSSADRWAACGCSNGRSASRTGSGGVAVTGQGVDDEHRVGSVGSELTPGLVRDLDPFEATPGLEGVRAVAEHGHEPAPAGFVARLPGTKRRAHQGPVSDRVVGWRVIVAVISAGVMLPSPTGSRPRGRRGCRRRSRCRCRAAPGRG